MICRFILSCSREEDFLAQPSLLCPELCCVTSPSLLKAGEWDLCFLFGDRHQFRDRVLQCRRAKPWCGMADDGEGE